MRANCCRAFRRRRGLSSRPLFAVSRLDPGALRLSFAGLEPGQIREGLAILGRILTDELKSAAQRFEPSPALV